MKKTKLTTHPLLLSILAAAEAKGLTQKTIAERAEMAPESLSRIIRTGRMELVTIEKLANTVGLQLFTAKAIDSPSPSVAVSNS
jgi:transcriptional regulator with XRE-family HTH domain